MCIEYYMWQLIDFDIFIIGNPVDKWRINNVIITSKRRHDVVLT